MSARAECVAGIDHIVLACPDLDDAADAARSLGFTVTARNHHELFRTSNRLVVLHGCYIELLAVDGRDPEQAWVQELLRSTLGTGGGLAMIALRAQDPSRLYAALRTRGAATQPPSSWSRAAQTETGTGIAHFTTMPISTPPGLGFTFFMCQQHTPEMIWREAWLHHDNSAIRLLGISRQTQDLDARESELRGLLGGGPAIFADEARIYLGDEWLSFLKPSAFEARLGTPIEHDGHETVVRIAVESIDQLGAAARTHFLVAESNRRVTSAAALPGLVFEFIETGKRPSDG